LKQTSEYFYIISTELVINRIGSPNMQTISQDRDEDSIKYHIEFFLYFKFKSMIIKWAVKSSEELIRSNRRMSMNELI